MHIHRSPEQIAADRARYEAHQRRGLDFAPAALPAPSPLPAPAPDPARIRHREAIAPDWYWTTRLAAGEVLRIAPEARDEIILPEARDEIIRPEARDGNGRPEGATSPVALACWSARDTSERLNLPDTVKIQWTTALAKGRVLFSDMGRVMLSITEDSSGAHDALTGGSSSGPGRNTRENMVLAAAKLGLDRRDIPALLTLFAPVRVDAEGRFTWNAGLLSGRDWVELRAEMDLFVALSTCPHPLHAEPAATMVATRLAPLPVAEDDLCRTATAEAVRGFDNNARM